MKTKQTDYPIIINIKSISLMTEDLPWKKKGIYEAIYIFWTVLVKPITIEKKKQINKKQMSKDVIMLVQEVVGDEMPWSDDRRPPSGYR